eukprot:4350862-Amphidinium_carterae.1
MENFHGNQEADVVASLGAAEHGLHEPYADWLHWELVAKAVRCFCILVCPKLRGLVSGCLHLCGVGTPA